MAAALACAAITSVWACRSRVRVPIMSGGSEEETGEVEVIETISKPVEVIGAPVMETVTSVEEGTLATLSTAVPTLASLPVVATPGSVTRTAYVSPALANVTVGTSAPPVPGVSTAGRLPASEGCTGDMLREGLPLPTLLASGLET